jgi:hypothetical protein
MCHFKPIMMRCKTHVSAKSVAKTMPVTARRQFLDSWFGILGPDLRTSWQKSGARRGPARQQRGKTVLALLAFAAAMLNALFD